jgi:hypothetical protein
MELLGRGEILADAIQASLQNLDQIVSYADREAATRDIVADPFEALRGSPSREFESHADPIITKFNEMWLLSTLVYLYTVMVGWQPHHAEIRGQVMLITRSLSELPKGACLRNLVWPYCIAGCLSSLEDEEKFRHMARRFGALQVFGTVKEATEIMEKVWACRDQLDESWDVSKCLQILGHRSLLI